MSGTHWAKHQRRTLKRNETQSLFDLQASHILARRQDPAPSHEAARAIVADGTLGRQQAEALAAVEAHGGQTSSEIAAASGVGRYDLARRLTELERVGKVTRGPARACRITGRTAATWMARKAET